MSFNTLETRNYINIKLTDEGRHQLSLGNLRFSKLVFSDREIDYGIDYSDSYSIDSNRILSPRDAHPNIDGVNLDGSNPTYLNSSNITALKQFITGATISSGHFTGSLNEWTFTSSLVTNTHTAAHTGQAWGTPVLKLSSTSNLPTNGSLLFCSWLPPQNTVATTYPTTYPAIPSGISYNGIWYGVISADTGTGNVYVDKPIPNFTNEAGQVLRVLYYPSNGVESYYGSGATQNTSAWSMNIIRTYEVPGTNINTEGISGFTQYGSIQYSGTKKYFGFGTETPAVGVIHYTNQYTGNTFGEQFIEKTVELHMPFVMWHKITGYTNGNATNLGLSCYDYYGKTKYDPIAKTSYRDLRDGIGSGSTSIGRVYHKLKMFVITDQEVLNALSYKSNRSYTYPEPIVELSSHSAQNVNYFSVSGLCESGKTYFVTLLFENSVYGSTTSFGYAPSIHSGYIKKINGENDINGRPKFLRVSFPDSSFPYMRSDSGLSTGTGWNANTVQVLVNEQPTDYNYDIANVPATGWTRVSSISSGGNGVYRAVDAGDSTIDPDLLNAHVFNISRQDYNSGSTYTLYSGCTSSQSVLNFGDEAFFFGNIKTQTIRTKYYSSIVGYALPHELNTSLNSTFDYFKNDYTYVSEIGVLDNDGNVVAVGKPTHPLKKEMNRILAVQLLLEF